MSNSPLGGQSMDQSLSSRQRRRRTTSYKHFICNELTHFVVVLAAVCCMAATAAAAASTTTNAILEATRFSSVDKLSSSLYADEEFRLLEQEELLQDHDDEYKNDLWEEYDWNQRLLLQRSKFSNTRSFYNNTGPNPQFYNGRVVGDGAFSGGGSMGMGMGMSSGRPGSSVVGRPGTMSTSSMTTTTTKTERHETACMKMVQDRMPSQSLSSMRQKSKKQTSGYQIQQQQSMLADGSIVSSTNPLDSEPVATCDNSIGFADTINGPFPCSNVDMLSFINMRDLNEVYGYFDDNANDMWGWVSPEGREFALVGTYQAVVFVEITNPSNPVIKGTLPNKNNAGGATGTSWGDVKTYGHYAYVVTEAINEGLQIFDLMQLVDDTTGVGIVFEETAHYAGFGNAHNLFVNEETGYAYIVGSNQCQGGLVMLDLNTDPLNPQPQPCIMDPDDPTKVFGYHSTNKADQQHYSYTHDVQCVIYRGPYNQNGVVPGVSELCFACNEDRVVIIDVTNKLNPLVLSQMTYANSGSTYTHQGWLTEDHEYFLFGDEKDERVYKVPTTTYIVNVQDVFNPSLVAAYPGRSDSIDHNMYIHNGYLYQANYRAGMQVYSLEDVANGNLIEEAYFDIFPRNNARYYNGAWSLYPYFPSGNIAMSGIEQGLFVLRAHLPTTSPTSSPTTSATNSPTSSPTIVMTSNPTSSSPTASPTGSPTSSSPTASPTGSPTTSVPTITPSTISPTISKSPATSPPTRSSKPTSASPTSGPTKTLVPTLKPSSVPSKSIQPTTSSPTGTPTTLSPTNAPTTLSPTKVPTSTPTSSPTSKPTPDLQGDDLVWVLLDETSFDTSLDRGIWTSSSETTWKQTLDENTVCLEGDDSTATTSTLTTDIINVSTARKLKVKFTFYPRHMTTGDSFDLQLNVDGTGTNWETIQSYVRGVEFRGHAKYTMEQIIDLSTNPRPTQALVRFTTTSTLPLFDISLYGFQLPPS